MKYFRIPLLALVALTMTGAAEMLAPVSHASASLVQTGPATALERGYRTGYSDGFSAGSKDVAQNAARDFRSNEDYQRGDRSCNEAWGTIEDYRDGYQQGFETGYNAGYDRRPFESTIPTGLTRRGVASNQSNNDPGQSSQSTIQNTPANIPDNANDAGQSSSRTQLGPLSILGNTVLLVELESSLSTDATQRGDRFQARVIEPREFAGALIDGRVTRGNRAGKVKGTAELQLAFEAIHMTDGRTAGFNAEVVEIVENGREDVGTVDSEGGVQGRSTTKDDPSKAGATP